MKIILAQTAISLSPSSQLTTWNSTQFIHFGIWSLSHAITKSGSVSYTLSSFICSSLNCTELQTGNSVQNSLTSSNPEVDINSCCAGKYCSNPQSIILNSSGDPKVSKDTIYVRLNFGEMCIKWFTATQQSLIDGTVQP